jgi:hypothetical protein
MPFPKPGGGSGITQLTGDAAAGPGSGSQPLTLASVVGAGTVGDTTHYPIVTFDAKGRVTGASAQAAPGPANGIGVITGDLTTPPASTPAQSVAGTLASVGTAGTYGSASLIPVITTDAKGRVTAVTTAAPSAGALTYVQSFITTPVTFTNGSTFYNVTSITLTAGTWLVNAQLILNAGASAVNQVFDLIVGTVSASISGSLIAATRVDSGLTDQPSLTLNASKILVIGSTTIIYLNGYASSAGSVAQATQGAAGDSCGISAVKIA